MLDFSLPTRICFGSDALSALKEYHGQLALLVTDPFFEKNGKAQRLLAQFSPESEIFSQIGGEPTVAMAAKGAQQLNRLRPRLLIALGGGSAMDCAKGMLAAWESGEAPCFAAIPTTSGTGSEVTSFAILTHQGVKKVLLEEKLRPQLAILDPELLTALPPSLIADGGMDALSHALEAAVAQKANPFTTALAVWAAQTLLQHLPDSYRGDTRLRGELHLAATMAGVAFDRAGLGACHALSHALGGRFHLPHGRLNAVLLPRVLEYNLEKCGERYGELAKKLHLSSGRSLVFALRRLCRELGLPRSLTAAGIPREALLSSLKELCQAALEDPCSASNPRKPSPEDYAGILRKCL